MKNNTTLTEYFTKIVEKFPNKIAMVTAYSTSSHNSQITSSRGLTAGSSKNTGFPASARNDGEQFAAMQIKLEKKYQQYSYQKIYQDAQAIAYFLKQNNIRKGNRVALILSNRPEWGAVYFGILFTGAIAVPIDPQASADDIDYCLKHSGSKLAITEELLKNGDIFKHQPEKPIITKLSADDPASILYTSGTTGKPKGVVLTHKNFFTNFNSIAKFNIFTKDDNILSILPLHHSFPFMITFLIPLFSGILITYPQTINNDAILQIMQETDVTILVGVPQLFSLLQKKLVKNIKQLPLLKRAFLWGIADLTALLHINISKILLRKLHANFGKKLRFFVCGGAKLDLEISKFFTNLGFTLIEGYGLTETSPVVTFNDPTKPKLGSVGKAISNVKIKIIDPDKQGVGEIAIKGPNVMEGYFKNKKATQEVLKNGWFYSGDLGYIDKDGYLFITGRKKELIVLSSGKNISPEEVEKHYGVSHFIKDICVLDVGKTGNEKLMAIIVPDAEYFRSIGEVNIYGLIKWDLENLSKHYSSYKRVMGFAIAKQELPRTRLGKLKRYIIKNDYEKLLLQTKPSKEVIEKALSNEDLQLMSSETTKQISKILQQEANITKPIRLDDHLEIDLGFDSLSRIELTAKLVKFYKITIPTATITQVFTVKELVQTIDKLLQKQTKKIVEQEFSWKEQLSHDPATDIITNIKLHPKTIEKFWTMCLTGIVRFFFIVFFPLKAQGRENLPIDKPFILCANHNSYLDGFAVGLALPKQMRTKAFSLGYQRFVTTPIIKNITPFLRIIPIDPGVHLLDAMQTAAYLLGKNKIVYIFPEGARSIDGEVKPFKKGVGILAKELDIPLIPVYIDGTFQAWPRGRKFPKPHKVTVTFGKPQTATELTTIGKKLGATADYEAITLAIRKNVETLHAINVFKKLKP